MIFAHHWINRHIIFLIGIEKETNLEKRNNDIRWEFFQIRVKKNIQGPDKTTKFVMRMIFVLTEYYFLCIQISVDLVKVEKAQKLKALFNENFKRWLVLIIFERLLSEVGDRLTWGEKQENWTDLDQFE